MGTPVSIYSGQMQQKDSETVKWMRVWYWLAKIGGGIPGSGGGIPSIPQTVTPAPKNMTAGQSVTAPIGSIGFSLILRTGTGTITVGAQPAFTLTIGSPIFYANPLGAAIVVQLGTPGTADVDWSS